MTFVEIEHVMLAMHPSGEALPRKSDELADRLIEAGFQVDLDADLPGHRRFYVSDPFGNRLEFMEHVTAS